MDRGVEPFIAKRLDFTEGKWGAMTRSKTVALFGAAILISGALATPAQGQWSFTRGDSNGDGSYNIADAVFILGFLFSSGPGPCLDAMDVNDDGANNIADAVFALDNLFGTAGTMPPAPFPACGTDPTADMLDCVGPLGGCPALPTGCLTNPECPTGEFCLLPPGDCGSGMVTGDCMEPPLFCPAIFDPVCGCDDQTYGNACEAAAAGVNVSYDGQCIPGACTDNSDCGPGEFCQKTIGNCGGVGQCSPIPLICNLIFSPVCGCNGVTYSNECMAWGDGVSADFAGNCP